MIVTIIPREALPHMWGKIAFLLAKSLPLVDVPRADPLSLYKACLAAQYHVWVVANEEKHVIAACLTQFIDYPAYRTLSVQYLGGDQMSKWLGPAFEVFRNFAKDNNCRTIEGYGREAWIRALSSATKRDWKKVCVIFELDLANDVADDAAADVAAE